ncbi:PEGA domain-containing protein [Candidatus Saccharibacteria bacterium]|nr:PEGA domain-containing protein [Candidatus Saccharibacteria bacterium]MCL1962744.1 PEGA domain-containing protein [Candidatus Saccharibacteria bacterium]
MIFCLFWAMGYRFDFASGKVSQIALLQFDSFPNGASVEVDGEKIPAATPTRTRIDVESGKSVVRFTKEGYRTWQKTAKVRPGEVLWLNYARLIPNNITTETIKNFIDIKEISASPNLHWLLIRNSDNSRYEDSAVYPNQTTAQYYKIPFPLILADISDPVNVRFSTIKIPSEAITVPTVPNADTEKFSIVEWSKDSRYILINHFVNGKNEYVILDRENPNSARNLTRDFNILASEMHFSNRNNLLIALIGSELRELNTDDSTYKLIASNVQSFSIYDNRVAIVTITSRDGESIQMISIYDGNKIRDIKNYEPRKADALPPTIVRLAHFENRDYLAIAREEIVTIYRDPLNQGVGKPIYLSSPGGITWLSISPKHQFIVAGHDDKVVSYDMDTNKNYSFEAASLSTPIWLDESHLVLNHNNQIQIIEFDGANRESIVSGHGHAVLSENQKYLFSLDSFDSGMILQMSKMVVE